jgi:L-arabinose isomerase
MSRPFQKKLERPDVEIINLGLIDSPERAMEAGHQFRREDVKRVSPTYRHIFEF